MTWNPYNLRFVATEQIEAGDHLCMKGEVRNISERRPRRPSGRGSSFLGTLKETSLAVAYKQILTTKRDRLETHKYENKTI